MADSSFDVVSKVDRQEIDNAINQAGKELSQRFDFRGTNATISWAGEDGVLIEADTEERVSAALDVFKDKLIKRGISLKALDADEPGLRQGLQALRPDQAGHRVRRRQEALQADPRRGPQGRPGADPGRPAAGERQEARRPPGRAAAAARRRPRRRRCSSTTTADRGQPTPARGASPTTAPPASQDAHPGGLRVRRLAPAPPATAKLVTTPSVRGQDLGRGPRRRGR